MKTYTVEELKVVLSEHAKWLRDEGGSLANLSYSDLRGSDLRDSDLRGSNMSYSDLSGSNLSGSYLSYSDLRGSDLRGSDLRGSDLSDSNLSGSNMSYSDLSGSNLSGSYLSYSNMSYSDLSGSNMRGSDLSGSDLRDSNLRGSDLRGSNMSGAFNIPAFQICEGDLIVYKKAHGHIITLAIPRDCPRTASIVGRKCRSAWALVLETDDGKEHASARRGGTVYKPGERVNADSYDDDWKVECSHGIHWFLTREEAENYDE